MVVVCPTVMPQSSDPHEYREMMNKLSPFATRVQVDLMDGTFAPHKNINPIQVWWPESMLVDIHVMYARPGDHLTTLVSLNPHSIILHYESEGDIVAYLEHIHKLGIKAGVALLPATKPEYARAAIEVADHVLLFAGKLGESSNADMQQLDKIAAIRHMNPNVEIGWDGGITLDNIKRIAEAGVNVLNSGGAINNAENPEIAYQQLHDRAVSVFE